MGEQNQLSKERFSTNLAIAGGASVISKTAAAPIERVKLLLQNQGELLKTGLLNKPYTGVGNCFRRVFQEEGLFSFWRGNHANVLRYFPTQVFLPFGGVTTLTSFLISLLRCKRANVRRYFPTQAFNFAFKGYFRTLLNHSKEKDGYIKWFASNVVTGSAAGATTSLLLYHLDYARTRLGTDLKECPVNEQRQFKGLVDVYSKTLSSDGVKGLYRGFSVSIIGITLYRGMYFGIYDSMKPVVLVGTLQDNFFASFLLGWSVTTFSGVCAYPFDTVRRRMMLTSGQAVKYRNFLHAFREIIHIEGFRALYRGVTANMLLGVAGAGVLSGYDQLYRIAYRKRPKFEPNTVK